MALASIEKLHEISVTIFILSNIHSLECVSIPFFFYHFYGYNFKHLGTQLFILSFGICSLDEI